MICHPAQRFGKRKHADRKSRSNIMDENLGQNIDQKLAKES